MKILFTFLGFIVFSILLNSQSIEEGKKMMDYEKYLTAEQIFQKHQNSAEGIYWLGQVKLAQKASVSDVRKLYEQGLNQFPKSDLLKIGLSHLDILDGKFSEAFRIQNEIFKNNVRDTEVCGAMARAQLSSPKSQTQTVIDRLKFCLDNTKKKPYELYLLLAKAYLKLDNTSEATYAYIAADELAPGNAAPLFQRAIMYDYTLNLNSEARFLEFLNKAIAKDKNFPPAYYYLFYYNYHKKETNKALGYFNQFAQLADKTPELDYITANVAFNTGDYAKAISLSENAIKTYGDNVDARYYKVLAHAQLNTKNITEAAKNLKLYITKEKPENIHYGDYMEAAKMYAELGDDAMTSEMFERALSLSEQKSQKYHVANAASAVYKSRVEANANQPDKQREFRKSYAKWLEILYYNKPDATNVDLYNFGIENYNLQNWEKVYEAFSLYAQKYPTQIQGHYFAGVAYSKEALNKPEIAIPHFEKAVEVGMTDTANNKYFLTNSLLFLANYAREKNDLNKSKEYARMILSYDPNEERAKLLL